MVVDSVSLVRIVKILKEVGVEDKEVIAVEEDLCSLESESGVPPLGYGIDLVVCSHCGHTHASVHPIPMSFPCECSKCKRMECFVKEERSV